MSWLIGLIESFESFLWLEAIHVTRLKWLVYSSYTDWWWLNEFIFTFCHDRVHWFGMSRIRVWLRCELDWSENSKKLKTRANTWPLSIYDPRTRFCETITAATCLITGGRAYVLGFALDAHKANLSEIWKETTMYGAIRYTYDSVSGLKTKIRTRTLLHLSHHTFRVSFITYWRRSA